MGLRRRMTVAGGVLLLTLTTAVVPASAAPLEHVHFEESGTGVLEDFCGSGIAVTFDFHLEGSLLGRAIGPDGLVYSQRNSHLTNTLTNTATGEFVTHVINILDKDTKVTDNGDGTLTIRVGQTGGDKWYDSDGKIVFKDGGGVWSEVLVDNNGTPTDPSDDEFIEFLGDVKVTGHEGTITDDNLCDQLLSVIG
jgi:hypothetical protein